MAHELVFNEADQGSEEWLQARVGMLTATDAKVLWVNGSNGWGEGAITLARKLVAEMLTGQSQDLTLKWSESLSEFYYDNFETGATKWGHVHEDRSREIISEKSKVDFLKIGFVSIKGKMVGCSPDGFSNQNVMRRVLEMKHPNSQKVIAYLDDINLLFKEHQYQCIHQAYVMEADEVWLAARDPRLPEPLDSTIALTVISGEKLAGLVSEYENKVKSFIEYVEKLKEKIISLA